MKRLVVGVFMLGNFLFANSNSEIIIETTASIRKRSYNEINRIYRDNKVKFKMNNIDEESLVYIKELGKGRTTGKILDSAGELQSISCSFNKLKDKLEGEVKFSKTMKGALTLRTVYN